MNWWLCLQEPLTFWNEDCIPRNFARHIYLLRETNNGFCCGGQCYIQWPCMNFYITLQIIHQFHSFEDSENNILLCLCRLHMIFSSPRHLMVAGGSIILLEIVYKMDFSLVGFVICCSILGFGMLKFSYIPFVIA